MTIEILLQKDFENYKAEILQEVKEIVHGNILHKPWLKSQEVQHILGCSRGKLQYLRKSQLLRFTKVGGTIYYCGESVKEVFEKTTLPLFNV